MEAMSEAIFEPHAVSAHRPEERRVASVLDSALSLAVGSAGDAEACAGFSRRLERGLQKRLASAATPINSFVQTMVVAKAMANAGHFVVVSADINAFAARAVLYLAESSTGLNGWHVQM